MSAISQLNKDLSNVNQILDKYKTMIVGWEDNLKIKGKNLEAANAEQPAYSAYYDQIKTELHVLLRYTDMQVRMTRGNIYKLITKTSSVDLTDKSKDRLIDVDPTYVKIFEIYLEVEEMFDKVESIVKQFEQRSYSLTNIVKIRTHNLENAHIDINE